MTFFLKYFFHNVYQGPKTTATWWKKRKNNLFEIDCKATDDGGGGAVNIGCMDGGTKMILHHSTTTVTE